MIPFAPLFPGEAQAALAVFKELRAVDVAGSPRLGDICEQWILDFVAAIFGAYDAESGRRLISEFFELVAKKNAKSTIAAAIMLTAAIRNWRPSAEFTILAPTIEIANNSFAPARDMVRADEELSDLFHLQEHYRTITHRQNGTVLKVVAADSESVGGKKSTGILIEELWLFGKRSNAENVLREATGGLASRPEGFVIYLSTQSDDAPAGVFKQKLQYARGVRDGRITDKRFLPVIYEFPEALIKDGRYRDPAFFYVPNPNINASVDAEFLERELRKAEELGQESLCGFLAKHLNVEIGLALKSNAWSGALFWGQQEDPRITLDYLLEHCEVIVVGIDGGGLDDLLGLTVLGREADSGDWLSWSHAWAHPSVMERRKSESERFLDFAKAGDLTLAKEIGEDVDQVAEIIARIEDAGLLDRVGVDPHGISDIVDAIAAKLGLTPEEVPKRIVGISQGWKLVGAIKTTERRLAAGGLKVATSLMMPWCVGNAKVEPRGNAVLITKQASGTAKIDPLMALFNCVSIMALNPEARNSIDGWLKAAA